MFTPPWAKRWFGATCRSASDRLPGKLGPRTIIEPGRPFQASFAPPRSEQAEEEGERGGLFAPSSVLKNWDRHLATTGFSRRFADAARSQSHFSTAC